MVDAAEEAVGDTTAVTENQKRLVALLDAAETQLSKSAFLAGDAYSAADVMLTCAVFLVDQAKQSKAMLTSRPNLLAWWKRMKTRPSFKVVFGPATSPKTMLTQVLPAVIKVMSCKVLRRY